MAAAKAPMQRGDRLRQGTLQRGMRHPQGAAATHDHSAGAAANGLQTATRGQPARGGRLRVRCLQEGSLRAKAPPARAAAPWQSGCRRARAATACAGAVAATVAQ
ncbi:hypothetical protein BHE74_00023702 [Ensete ventricosum]|nr:hypothetical protein BHE74_00023702 [Ensete ventricosum]